MNAKMNYFPSSLDLPSRGIWNKANKVQSENLLRLSATLPTIIRAGLADSTNEKYESGWKKWCAWCKENPELLHRPAEPFFVSLYLNHLLQTKKKVGAINNAFYGIRWGHHIVGLNSPTDNPFVMLAKEGCIRLCEHDKNKKVPLNANDIKLLVNSYLGNNYDLLKARTIVTCLLGFTGFFRISELISVQLKHLKFYPDHLSIYLSKSKCDQHREGHNVLIARLDSQYCPVAFVENFLAKCKFDVLNDKDSYLIPRLAKTDDGHKVFKDKGISYSAIHKAFKNAISNIVDDKSNYGLHSLRSGGASAAANNNISDRKISKQGRWKSEKSRNTYIQDSLEDRLSVSKKLGL